MTPEKYRETSARLENWGRWARSGGSSQGRCGSIEGRYIREKNDGEERLAKASRIPIDVCDAEVLEVVVIALRGARMRAILVARFADQMTRVEICRKLKIHWSLFEPSLRRAVYEVARALDNNSHRQPVRWRPVVVLA